MKKKTEMNIRNAMQRLRLLKTKTNKNRENRGGSGRKISKTKSLVCGGSIEVLLICLGKVQIFHEGFDGIEDGDGCVMACVCGDGLKKPEC